MRYRRAFVPGGTWFFTLVTADRRCEFINEQRIETLRNAFRTVRRNHPFRIDAIVILQDHLHCILSLPPGDADFALRWRLVKTWYTKHRPGSRPIVSNQSRRNKEQQQLWQHRYWEHLLRDEQDLAHHVDYIHFNPVKHAYVERVRDWPWSSFHRYVEKGLLDVDWGSAGIDVPVGVGHE